MGLLDTKRLLKADAVRNLGTKVVFNFDDLTTRCEEQIAAVRQQAAEILASAGQEAEKIRQDAHSIGYQTGFDEGLKKSSQSLDDRVAKVAHARFEQELEKSLPVLQQAASAINIEHERWLSHWETSAIRLAASIASRILHNAIRLNPELAEVTAREALKLAAGKTQVSLRMNPQDIEVLGPRLLELTGSMKFAGHVPVLPDPAIERGGCMVQTEHGEIDARIESQIEHIVHQLLS